MNDLSKMKTNSHLTPPNAPIAGVPNQGQGDASNSGDAPAPASPPLSLLGVPALAGSPSDLSDPSDPSDRKAQLEALRLLIQQQHSDNQKLLQNILEVEQASAWANHPAALNAVCQILSETKDFHSWLLQLQLKMTFATAHKK